MKKLISILLLVSLSLTACSPTFRPTPKRGALGGVPGGGFIPPTKNGGGGGTGDIAAVNVTSPIVGGGTTGSVTIGFLTCAASQIVKMNLGGTAWACDSDATGGGGVTDGDKGDITVSASGASWVIDAAAVTLAKMANIPTQTFIGRTAALAGTPEALTPAQATAMLDPVTSVAKGVVPASGGGTANYFRADGTWAVPPGTSTGDITDVVAGAGMTGGAASGAATVNAIAGVGITVNADDITIDPTYTQRRVSGTCAAGASIRTIDQAGAVVCETDDNSGITNSAGTNVIPKSNGTNLVASTISDDSTTVTIAQPTRVDAGTSGAVAALAGSNLIVEGAAAANNYMTMLTPNGVNGGVLFNTPTLAADGYVLYDGTARRLGFAAGGLQNLQLTGTLFTVSVATTIGGAATLSSTLNVNGATTVAEMRGSEATASVTGSINDLAVASSATILRLTTTGIVELTGITNGAQGRELTVINAGSGALKLYPTLGSAAANQFASGAGSILWLSAGDGVILRYSGSKWHIVAISTDLFNTIEVVSSAQFNSTITVAGAATLNSTLAVAGAATVSGQFKDGGTPPVAGGMTCGTTPSATGGAYAFTVTAGTGTAVTCAINFTNAYSAIPVCVIAPHSGTRTDIYISAITASAIEISNTAGANMAGNKISVICVGDG